MGGIGALTEDGEVRREGGRKPAARWNSSWRVPSSVPASAPGQLVRTPDSCEAEGPGRKLGLAPTCTAPRPEPAAPGSRPPTCKNTPPPALTPSLHSPPPLGLLLVPNRTCRTPPPKIVPAPALPTFHLPPAIQAWCLAKGPFPACYQVPEIISPK